MFEHRQIKLDYDNRFGFRKYCSAFWTFDNERVGEQFIFKFRNEIEVSVIRSTMWNYSYAAACLSTSSSMGFAFGKYEVLVTDNHGVPLYQDGYLDHKQVQKLLSKWGNAVNKKQYWEFPKGG